MRKASWILRIRAGEYQLAAWHEFYGEKVQTIKVIAGESWNVGFDIGLP